MPRAISPIETPSDWYRRINVLITPGDSFVRVPSAAMRSTCSPSNATRRKRSNASSARPMPPIVAPPKLFDNPIHLSHIKYSDAPHTHPGRHTRLHPLPRAPAHLDRGRPGLHHVDPRHDDRG